jgi:hypothetical protein
VKRLVAGSTDDVWSAKVAPYVLDEGSVCEAAVGDEDKERAGEA